MDQLRYERKFVSDDLCRRDVEHIIRLHPSLFHEIYHARRVNNIYFDTICRSLYRDSVDGAPSRVKVRIRWYGETFGNVASPTLEFKRKCGLMVWKESFKLEDFSVDRGTDLRLLHDILRHASLESQLHDSVLSMMPVLLNRYERRYYLSADKEYRVTVDDALCSYRLRPRLNTFLDKTADHRHVIVELKYGCEVSQGADRIAQRLPFRVTRWSKYVNGLTPGGI
jgi:SPX domain protein involved in polyphosphate accumulation